MEANSREDEVEIDANCPTVFFGMEDLPKAKPEGAEVFALDTWTVEEVSISFTNDFSAFDSSIFDLFSPDTSEFSILLGEIGLLNGKTKGIRVFGPLNVNTCAC